MKDAPKIDLFKELKKTEYAQPKTPRLIDIADRRYLVIDTMPRGARVR